MNTIERIEKLMQSHDINDFKLEKQLKLARGIVYKWKSGRQNPSTDAITKIAEYFNVSTDYLLGREESQEKKPIDESISFEKFSKMLHEKGLTEKDLERLTKEQLATIGDIIKNFKP